MRAKVGYIQFIILRYLNLHCILCSFARRVYGELCKMWLWPLIFEGYITGLTAVSPLAIVLSLAFKNPNHF